MPAQPSQEIIEAPDLSNVQTPEYQNKWVALSEDYEQVYASADSLRIKQKAHT